MSPDQHQQIPAKVLDDLCRWFEILFFYFIHSFIHISNRSRFIINIPAEQREDLVRVLFAVELAHWFFIDFYCEDYNDLHVCNIREFAQQSKFSKEERKCFFFIFIICFFMISFSTLPFSTWLRPQSWHNTFTLAWI